MHSLLIFFCLFLGSFLSFSLLLLPLLFLSFCLTPQPVPVSLLLNFSLAGPFCLSSRAPPPSSLPYLLCLKSFPPSQPNILLLSLPVFCLSVWLTLFLPNSNGLRDFKDSREIPSEWTFLRGCQSLGMCVMVGPCCALLGVRSSLLSIQCTDAVIHTRLHICL